MQNQICSHTALKYSNCEENYTANNNICEFKMSIENKTIKYFQQKNQQIKKSSFSVIIDNDRKW